MRRFNAPARSAGHARKLADEAQVGFIFRRPEISADRGHRDGINVTHSLILREYLPQVNGFYWISKSFRTTIQSEHYENYQTEAEAEPRKGRNKARSGKAANSGACSGL